MKSARLAKRLFVSVLLLAAAPALGAERLAEQPFCGIVATFELNEAVGFDWNRDLLNYRVELPIGKAKPGELTLLGPGGKVPFQLDSVLLHDDGSIRTAMVRFYIDGLPPWDAQRYDLYATGPASPPAAPRYYPGVTVVPGKWVQLSNSYATIRLPGVGKVVNEPPLSLAESAGPIVGFRLAGGQWVGGSRFECAADFEQAPLVKSVETSILANGPMMGEAVVRYELSNGGHYEMRVRLEAESPMILLSEEADVKIVEPIGHRDRDALDMHRLRVIHALSGPNWQPDALYGESWGGGYYTPVSPEPDKDLLAKLDAAGVALPDPVRRHNRFLRGIPSDGRLHRLFGLRILMTWTHDPTVFALLREEDLVQEPQQRSFVGVVPLHTGSWRNAQGTPRSISVVRETEGSVALVAPLTAPARPHSVLHSGEYDTDLPDSLLRRQWGIMLGALPEQLNVLGQALTHHGYLALDQYKDWVLDWAIDERYTYPRQFFNREELDKALQRLDQNPYRNLILEPAANASSGDNPVRIRAMHEYGDVMRDPFKKLEEALRMLEPKSGVWTCGGAAGQFRSLFNALGGRADVTQQAGWTMHADSALSWDGMPDSLRRRVRAALAAIAYLNTDPDVFPRASGVHLGNPNMPIQKFLLPYVANLIPDHPMAPKWMEASAQFVRYKMQLLSAPKGGWGEMIHYFNASVPHMGRMILALENSPQADPRTIREFAMIPRFAASLMTPPDPRFGVRVIPGLGHCGTHVNCYALPTAVMMKERDPELAGELLWAWRAGGEPMDGGTGFDDHMRLLPMFTEIPTPALPEKLLRSQWYPGAGAVLRAHPGSSDETYLLYSQGYFSSHRDSDQGEFVVYAKGAPLSPIPMRGYVTHQTSPHNDWGGSQGLYQTRCDIYNRVRLGAPDETGGWPGGGLESNVNEFYGGETLDYLCGWGDYERTNKWQPNDAEVERNGEEPAEFIRWIRQLVFLKSDRADGPNYFVFRDSFSGTGRQPKYWHLRGSVEPERVSIEGQTIEIEPPYSASLHATFLEPQHLKTEKITGTSEIRFPPGSEGRFWEKVHGIKEGQRPGQPVCLETITITQVEAGPDEEFLVVLYPRKQNETVPEYRRLAQGVLESRTADGIDYVFLGGLEDMQYADRQVRFKGRAGSVRVLAEKVILSVLAGDGEVEAGYGPITYRGSAPFEVTVPKNKLDKKIVSLPAPKYTIDFKDAKLKRGGEGIVFESNAQGGVELLKNGAVRLVLGPGRGRVGYRDFVVWGEGPFDLTYDADGVHGVTEGRERMIYATSPVIGRGVPVLWIDGAGSAPGYSRDGANLAIPVLDGRHEIAIRTATPPDMLH